LLQGPGCHASDGNMVGPSATYVGQQIAMRSLQILVKDKDVHVAFCVLPRGLCKCRSHNKYINTIHTYMYLCGHMDLLGLILTFVRMFFLEVCDIIYSGSLAEAWGPSSWGVKLWQLCRKDYGRREEFWIIGIVSLGSRLKWWCPVVHCGTLPLGAGNNQCTTAWWPGRRLKGLRGKRRLRWQFCCPCCNPQLQNRNRNTSSAADISLAIHQCQSIVLSSSTHVI